MNTRVSPWHDSRFYLATTAVITSIGLFAWLRLTIADTHEFYTTTAQLYGAIAAGLLYITLIISPIRTITGATHLRHLLYARRGFGVGAFYYALLHATIMSLSHINLLDFFAMPSSLQWSVSAGIGALLILILLAATPDKLIPALPAKWWHRIHRLVYVAGVAIVLHMYSIGAHFLLPAVQQVVFVALLVLFALQSYRFTLFLSHKFTWFNRTEVVILSVIMSIILGFFLALLPQQPAHAHGVDGHHHPSPTAQQHAPNATASADNSSKPIRTKAYSHHTLWAQILLGASGLALALLATAAFVNRRHIAKHSVFKW